MFFFYNNNTGARLTSVVEKISTFGISKIYNRLRQATQGFEDDEIDVTLPRFSTTSDFILNIILEQVSNFLLFINKFLMLVHSL